MASRLLGSPFREIRCNAARFARCCPLLLALRSPLRPVPRLEAPDLQLPGARLGHPTVLEWRVSAYHGPVAGCLTPAWPPPISHWTGRPAWLPQRPISQWNGRPALRTREQATKDGPGTRGPEKRVRRKYAMRQRDTSGGSPLTRSRLGSQSRPRCTLTGCPFDSPAKATQQQPLQQPTNTTQPLCTQLSTLNYHYYYAFPTNIRPPRQ